MYVTEGSSCWGITEDSYEIVPELECSHEEVDTRMLLHAKSSLQMAQTWSYCSLDTACPLKHPHEGRKRFEDKDN